MVIIITNLMPIIIIINFIIIIIGKTHYRQGFGKAYSADALRSIKSKIYDKEK